MASTGSTRTQILVDLAFKENYSVNGHLVKVFQKRLDGYPFFIHMSSKGEPFELTGFQVKNQTTLSIKKENVYMVTVYYDKKLSEILLVETLTRDEYEVEEHRYFALTTFEPKKTFWVEYLFTNNETLDEGNIAQVLEKAKDKYLLSQIKFKYGNFRIDKIHDPEQKYVAQIPISIKPTKTPTVDIESGKKNVTIVTEGGEVIEFEAQEFVRSKTGMATVLAGGSVGGTVIYFISHYI